MSDNQVPRQGTAAQIVSQFRSGPTDSLTGGSGWRWDEAIWVIAISAWFGTTGRPIELLVAVSLITVWLTAPGIVVAVIGHLAVTALGILPRIWWALTVTEALLILPVLIELRRFAPGQRSELQAIGGLLIVTAAITIGVAAEWSLTRLTITLAGLYCLGMIVVRVTDSNRSLSTAPSQDADAATETPISPATELPETPPDPETHD